MQEVTTIPGKTYAVECAGEVVITNNETGAIAAQGDGSGQVLFTACSNSYSVSSDTAKVVALFKLAPRLKLTLLQGVAGGLLPKGFTELEYLETSGTQRMDITGTFDKDTGLWKDVQQELTAYNSNQPTFSTENKTVEGNWWVFPARMRAGSSSVKEGYWYKTSYSFTGLQAGTRFQAGVHWLGENTAFITENGITKTQTLSTGLDFSATTLLLVGGTNIKFFEIKVSRGNAVEMDFVPVLNADKEPGMYDKVSKTFYGNQGTGTFGYRIKRTGETSAPMSLRDPWRVAPSGVWAKLKAANELDIIADTELVDGEPLGYTWHSNVGEAYDAYGIVIQDELN